MAEQPNSIEVPAVWVGAEETPEFLGGEFIIQYHGGAFHLTVGQPTPPVLVGTPEEMAEQVKRVQFVPIRVMGRYAITPEKYRELVAALNQNLARYEEAQEQAK